MASTKRQRVVTSVALDPDQIEALDRLARNRRGERSQLIRQAIDLLLRSREACDV